MVRTKETLQYSLESSEAICPYIFHLLNPEHCGSETFSLHSVHWPVTWAIDLLFQGPRLSFSLASQSICVWLCMSAVVHICVCICIAAFWIITQEHACSVTGLWHHFIRWLWMRLTVKLDMVGIFSLKWTLIMEMCKASLRRVCNADIIGIVTEEFTSQQTSPRRYTVLFHSTGHLICLIEDV